MRGGNHDQVVTERVAAERRRSAFAPRRHSTRARAYAVARHLNGLVRALADRKDRSLPAGIEWVLDNHFVLRRATRQVRRGFTREFERQLARAELGTGADRGLRRIEVEAFSLLREGEGLIDRELMIRRAREFGQQHDASMAELWALPMLLRLGLLEQLARDVPRLLHPMIDTAIDHRVANCVRSLLLVEKTDWARFFEAVSEVHRILSRDPSGVYPTMDFATRDRYRQIIEALAHRSELSETGVATRAIELVGEDGHVGHVLLASPNREARSELERAIGYRPSLGDRVLVPLRRHAASLYIGSIGLVAALHVAALGVGLRAAGTSLGLVLLACALVLIPGWTIGVSLVNWLVTLAVEPIPLPKLDFIDGVPRQHRTLIVVPGLLNRPGDADALAHRLESHYLATRDPMVEVAMLTDYGDAATETLPSDDDLIERARGQIVALNRRHGLPAGRADEGPFHLFHRRRVWCPNQGCWMGWERKRGKLDELNRLLRGDLDTTYVVHEGREGHFAEFRYVLTLDADTVLPLGAGRRLIETLAHPLNRACFDADLRVRAGYTVLQPRADVAPDDASTRFARAFAGDGAFDIYTRAVSDVYQDLFGEGIFVGKGIYAIDDFQRSLAARIPEDRILSHDLLEGLHGRAGLVTDVVVYEDYPQNWLGFARRLHRWVRGDWQLLAWLGRRVPVTGGQRTRSRFDGIARYKIVDNLRRSLVAPTLIGLAVTAWFALPGSAWMWTGLVSLLLATPALTDLAGGVLSSARPGRVRAALWGTVVSAPAAIGRWLLRTTTLLDEAQICLDAAGRAIVRTAITRRNQLEWTPAAQAGRGSDDPVTVIREMAPSLVVPPVLAALLVVVRPEAFAGALPILLAWFVAPPLAIWTGRAGRRRVHAPVSVDRALLRRLARRTWAYFEAIVGPEDHWLPPDNLQEQPIHEVAHRTSPTNIGMALLATLAARDLGYIDLLELVVRLRSTIETLGQLPQHRGHVINWIDTTTLEPLEPRYISTVDSGNLAAALIVLEQTCLELAQEARPVRGRFAGLADSLDVLGDALTHWGPEADRAARQVQLMRGHVDAVTDDPRSWSMSLDALDDGAFVQLDVRLLELFDARRSEAAFEPARFEELQTWATRIRTEVEDVRAEMAGQLPWFEFVSERPDLVPVGARRLVDALCDALGRVPTLGRTHAVLGRALARVEALQRSRDGHEHGEYTHEYTQWLDQLEQALRASLDHAQLARARLAEVAELARELVAAMDFEFLYDRERELTYIGYDLSSQRYDDHHYDLLASEARLASFVGIAKGDIPIQHWAKLGRPIGNFGAGRGLLSWSGTMFEYLMPPLLLDEGRGTLLDASARAAIRAQIEHADRHRLPWGMSESAYARLDAGFRYQYRAFGVPATGFRRGLDRDLVVAPYASLLALHHEPAAVVDNLGALAAVGGFGPLGVYEAIDFTRERIGLGSDRAVVYAYMSHHQGMIMLALHGYLCDRAMVRRMHRNPAVRTIELLLHERSPGRVPIERPQPAEEGPPVRPRLDSVRGWAADPVDGASAHVVSNGRYGLLITRAGAGHSWWKDRAITRPCRDATLEDLGAVTYLREHDTGEVWCSLGGADDPNREVVFTPHGASIVTHHHGLVAELTITVAPVEDVELRILRVSDRRGRTRRLTVSHYAEILLGDAVEYERHPAFAKLFVDTQLIVTPYPMILCRRRPRAPGGEQLWLACALISDAVAWSGYETDRARFVGRGRSLTDPVGLTRALPSVETPMQATLDTCVAMTGEVELAARGSCECAFISVFGRSRAEVLARASRISTMAAVRRHAFDAERTAIERAQRRGHDTDELRLHQRLLSAMLFPRAELRVTGETLARNRLSQVGLWRHGISGDLPIVLARVSTVGTGVITRLARAHMHWHERGLAADLVVLEERSPSYDGSLRQRLAQLLEHLGARIAREGGGVFVIHGASSSAAERNLLLSSASLVLDADLDLEAALTPIGVPELPLFEPEGQPRPPTTSLARPRDLLFDNGYGGFSPDGREYVVHLEPGQSTPAPWINVLANPEFGCIISERGAGYAWSINAGLRRLTPWSNDPVLDPPSISLYLRDELDAEVWSPMPAPAPYPAPYQVRHGAGYTSFTHHGHGLRQQTEVFVTPRDPVGVIRLGLVNTWDRPRRLTVTLCIEWLLGSRKSDTRTLISDFVPEFEVMLARNPWNPSFADRWAFAAASERLHAVTTSREEFFGRSGDRRLPAALRRIGLSGEVLLGSDPCAVLQVEVELGPGADTQLHFVFGEAEDRSSALGLARRYRDPALVREAREQVDHHWDRLLSAVEVHSPDPGFDLMVNRWLLYQSVSSRLWGRTGFYQSSGAFGFRDQLQDVMALVHAAPELQRAFLLEAAGQQFEAGDVLHWWHPPHNAGLRSRCSDDLVWLPLVTAHYVEATADLTVLAEQVRFLDAPPLATREQERYHAGLGPGFGSELQVDGSATLYEHCMRVFARASDVGAHGLPLIGSGDWNDGFSNVGVLGRGESVWLGWFVRAAALAFAGVCERLGELGDARELRSRVAALREPLESAWDGAWYVRAIHDDGAPLGASGSEACAIDSIAQSWSVLSGGANELRARVAMNSVWQRLVMQDQRIVRLFTPPFRSAVARVGYVEGYPPGIRENGGQYTHAAVWVAWALAELGESERAWAVASMIGPLAHGSDSEAIERYRVEPYVVAADIYSEPPHVGRGGWTWYTGAAGWLYRLSVERLLGVRRSEGRITLAPTLPRAWPSAELVLRDGQTVYRVQITKRDLGREVIACTVDGVAVAVPTVLPAPDQREHAVVITLD
ncbi:GH36-type glycosyl hydrolase domain-containing protein [Enhygromyxa salina]|uniref:N,N'-diacetylchitobiose phosphorylase n=1 Tax=Enhygromyxa salina TaxID=215803 RepID=A0A2S9YQ01_9BACT|nr:glucoamylase family protein [Enhygromyxa salina]PRQ07167.1 N,N'-diacetylchitobiose phosphorylase [Enhygromyxa salina]